MTHSSKHSRPLQRYGVCLTALLILLFAFVLHRVIPSSNPPAEWQVHHFDQGDYRFVAEYFWGVPFDPATYGEDFADQWGAYLKRVPVRDIGLGTMLIAYRAFTKPFSGAAWHDPASAATGFIVLTRFCLVLSSLLLFSVLQKRFGATIALVSFAIIVFMPPLWSMGQEFLTEPWIRCFLLILLSILLAVSETKRLDRLAVGMAVVLILLVEFKVQWIMLIVPLGIALVSLAWQARTDFWQWSQIVGAFVAVPLSIIMIHAIGWGTANISPGVGLHVNFERGGALYREYCALFGNAQRAFCDPALQKIGWWGVPVGSQVPTSDFEDFDRFVRADILQHPVVASQKFIEGLRLATNFPVDSAIAPVRWFWNVVDALCWIMLVIGLVSPRTRLLASFGLGVWIVPAIGQIFSAYDLRYHIPMAGIVMVIAMLIAIDLRHAQHGTKQA